MQMLRINEASRYLLKFNTLITMVAEEILLVLFGRRELQHGDREAVVVGGSERGEGESVVVLVEELGHLVAVQVDLVEAVRPHHDMLPAEIHTAARLARRQLLCQNVRKIFIKLFGLGIRVHLRSDQGPFSLTVNITVYCTV